MKEMVDNKTENPLPKAVVKSVLRLFDELVKCDSEGVLKEARKAAEGVT
ncbi:MAG: hypothetical protein HY865_21890 [Chloroflexi bacterium]|nr:hypothetical protein [Chloroflexota bacterium]